MGSKPKLIGDILKEDDGKPAVDARYSILIVGVSAYPAPKVVRERDLIHENLRVVMNELAAGVRPWPLLLYGGTGSGKTSAALCMHDLYGGWYTTLPDMVERYWAATRGELLTSRGYSWSLEEVRNSWSLCQLTVLDEIGERKEVSEAHYEVTKKLIDWRMRDGPMPAIYVSNREPEELQSIYGDPVSSRLTSGTVAWLNGDLRQGEKTAFSVSGDVGGVRFLPSLH